MFDITGRILTINVVSPKAAQVVIRKQIQGKATAIAIDVFGFWKEKMEKLSLKKNDKIRGRVFVKSNLYKGKWYTDLYFRDIERMPVKGKGGVADSIVFDPNDCIGEVKHFYDDKGNILL